MQSHPFIYSSQECTLGKGYCSKDIQATIPYYSNHSLNDDKYFPTKPCPRTLQVRKKSTNKGGQGAFSRERERDKPQMHWSSAPLRSTDHLPLSHSPLSRSISTNALSILCTLIHHVYHSLPLEIFYYSHPQETDLNIRVHRRGTPTPSCLNFCLWWLRKSRPGGRSHAWHLSLTTRAISGGPTIALHLQLQNDDPESAHPCYGNIYHSYSS